MSSSLIADGARSTGNALFRVLVQNGGEGGFLAGARASGHDNEVLIVCSTRKRSVTISVTGVRQPLLRHARLNSG